MIATNLIISSANRNQLISLGNAYSGSETLFMCVEMVGEDVSTGFVRRDRGNGNYLIGKVTVGKEDSDFVATLIRTLPVQIEIYRDAAGNISLVHHEPSQGLGSFKFNVYIYAHSSARI